MAAVGGAGLGSMDTGIERGRWRSEGDRWMRSQLSVFTSPVGWIELLATLGWRLLSWMCLRIRGLNLPLNTAVLADLDALCPERLYVNAETSVRFRLHYRIGDGYRHVSIFICHATQPQ